MNTPAPTNFCRQCGGPMASNAPEGLCARCLLSVAMKEPDLSDKSESADSASQTNLPPSPAPSDIPDIADAAEVARRLPQFEILELLGRGGMGVVYKARQLNLDRIVALKILPPADALTPDFVERFRREARSLAKLSHPNIVSVYEIGESGGLYYFVMEFVDGANLRAMIRAGKMKPEEALAVVPKICDALQFAHEEGVVHRDIKPENILIDKRGRVKIADFGLAKLLRREQTDNTLTMSGMTLGTPRYMAPEQMDKPETVDHRADIYSLGVVFYEMLTGEVPMGCFAPPSERVQIDVRLDEIVLHALERDADRRYQHASQVRDDVEKVTSEPLGVPMPKSDPPLVSEPLQGTPKTSVVAPRKWRLGASAWQVAACALGFVGCVWPCAIVEHGFFGGPKYLNMSEDAKARDGIYVGSFFATEAPAGRAGLLSGDTIMSVAGLATHLGGLESPDDIWKKIPAGTDVQIKVRRDGKEIVLRTVRSRDPIVARVYSLWQFIAGIAYVLFVLFVWIGQSLPRAVRWRGVAAIVLGLGTLALMFFSDQTGLIHPVKLMWGSLPFAFNGEWIDFGQKLTVCTGALALIVLGVLDFRREFSQPKPDAAPLSPAEEAVRRARASWFGRRSERFRTLLPPALVFLEIVLILASLAGWPSPWMEWTWTYTPHKHGVIGSTSSFAFHPFRFSFLLLLIGFALPFLAGRCSQIDNLVRYGRSFRELRKDIRSRAKLKIFGCLAAALLLPFLISVLFQVIASGGVPRVVGSTYLEFQLWPNSKAYEQLLIDLPFYSQFENGVEYYRRPNQWDMAIGLKTKDSAEPVTMDIEMPSLHASYLPSWSKDMEMSIVLDLDELTKWMSARSKLDVKDEKVKKEAAELMALLKRFSRQAPAEMNEFDAAREELMPDFSFAGSRNWPGKTSSFSSMNGGWIMAIYLGSAVIFLALYFVVAIRIQRAAFALDREVREHGESVLARGPLPRVKFGALPRDIRARTIRRAVLAAVGLLILPGIAALMESAQPKHVKETYYYGFAPQVVFEKADAGDGATGTAPWPSPLLKHFQEVIMTFAFESYERGGEKWFVQPHPFQLELTFCRPKNFSDKPGEFHEVIPPGKGVPEGETFSFTVELPGLHANMDYISNKSSVTLDEEELLLWMENTIATTTVHPTGARGGATRGFRKPDGTMVTLYSLPMSETPELKSLAADLMAFLKNYATSAPTTHDAFMAAARKIPSLNGHSATGAPREHLTHEGVAIIPALVAAILIFLALLPLLKRSAVRAAMRQGSLDFAPQTPAPADQAKPDGEKIASEPSLSRLALWGAISAGASVIAAAAVALCYALFFFLPENGPSAVSASGHRPPGFEFAAGLWCVAFGCLAISATVLGAIAITKIKRSNGKLYGLRLAAVDALLFPVIALFLTIGLIVGCFINKSHIGVGIIAIVALVVCFVAGRKAWRAIIGQPAGLKASTSAPDNL